MKHRIIYSVLLLACLFFVLLYTGTINLPFLEQENTEEVVQITEQKNTKEQQVAPGITYGKITDTFDVAGYTYAEVDTGKEKVWAAGPITQLEIGDTIAFSTGMRMENFHSTSLERDFPVIYFTGKFIPNEETQTNKHAATEAPHAQIKAPHAQINQEGVSITAEGINKVEGGNTIAEIYTQKNNLKGKTIRVRGQVTKFNSEVMGKNWIHILDSSTTDDLTITTDSTAAVNDIIIVEGKLELDKDFGYGYAYPVLLEDAKITKD